MAEHVDNGIRFLAKLPESVLHQLSVIYNWSHLSIAHEGGYYWLRGMTEVEMESMEIKSIIGLERFYAKKGKLYPFGHLLPIGNEPSFLWTDIKRAISLELPSKNYNFFHLEPSIEIKIVPSTNFREANCLRYDLDDFAAYVKTETSMRLNVLLCTIIDREVLIVGRPLLPLPGKTYWKQGSIFLPSGYDFELPILASSIHKKVNPQNEYDILWNVDGSYLKIPKTAFSALTRSSVARTMISMNKPEM